MTGGGRREDDRLVSGQGRYADDVAHEGTLHIAFVRSPYPCARIVSMDVGTAIESPGVIAVLTGSDLLSDGVEECPRPFRFDQGDGTYAVETPRPFLAHEQVRFVGEPVAMVVAQTLAAAMDAAELVAVDYQETSAVTDVMVAITQADAPLVWQDRPGNIGYRWRQGDEAKVSAALSAAHHVARLTSHISRVAAMPMEPRSALTYIDAQDRRNLRGIHHTRHRSRGGGCPDPYTDHGGLPRRGAARCDLRH